MPNKNRSKDSKAPSQKNSLNPPGGGKKHSEGVTPFDNPSNLVNETDTDKIGQFTGRGAPGLQKK